MNGIHDMGGMQGMGPIEYEEKEPVFHAPWEGRVHGLNMTISMGPGFRHAIERMDPVEYLTTSYYEHWLHSIETRGIAHGRYGRMGYGATVYLTAVGDTVHVASRFQDLTKQYQAQLVISEQVAERAGVDVSAFPRHEITVRNRREPLAIRVIDDTRALDAAGRGLPE